MIKKIVSQKEFINAFRKNGCSKMAKIFKVSEHAIRTRIGMINSNLKKTRKTKLHLSCQNCGNRFFKIIVLNDFYLNNIKCPKCKKYFRGKSL
jgi:predicted RNA-binding protein with EMAP domain